MKIKTNQWVKIADNVIVPNMSELDMVYRRMQVILFDRQTVTGWIGDCIRTIKRSDIAK